MILQQLNSSLKSSWVDHVKDSSIQNIVMTLPDTEPEEGSLYLGDSKVILPLLQRWKGDFPIMFILSEGGSAGLIEPLAAKGNCLWAISSLSTLQVGNILMSFYFTWEKCLAELQAEILRGANISQILKSMARLLERPMFWLNAQGQVLAADVEYSFENRYIMDFLIDGCISDDFAEQVRKHGSKISGRPITDISAIHFVLDSMTYGILCEVRKNRTEIGRLLILSAASEIDYLLLDNFRSLIPALRQYASLQKIEQYRDDSGFADLLEDLLERHLHSDEDLNRRAAKAGILQGNWYQWILAVPMEAGKDISMDRSLLKALAVIFPKAKITVRENRVLILNSRNCYSEMFAEEEFLMSLAEEFDIRICIGSFAKTLFFLKQAYEQSCAELSVCAKIYPDLRVIYGERHQLFHIIDMCFRHAGGYHEGNLLFLCSPRYAELLRYDQAHNTDLCQTLEAYRQNGYNTSQTAKSMYIHRNTLIGRINRIEELLGGSLDNDTLRINCAFSAAVVAYTEKYLGKDPLDLKFLWEESETLQ